MLGKPPPYLLIGRLLCFPCIELAFRCFSADFFCPGSVPLYLKNSIGPDEQSWRIDCPKFMSLNDAASLRRGRAWCAHARVG
jgi:hypothetical protein